MSSDGKQRKGTGQKVYKKNIRLGVANCRNMCYNNREVSDG